jgi:hypothetical protein
LATATIELMSIRLRRTTGSRSLRRVVHLVALVHVRLNGVIRAARVAGPVGVGDVRGAATSAAVRTSATSAARVAGPVVMDHVRGAATVRTSATTRAPAHLSTASRARRPVVPRGQMILAAVVIGSASWRPVIGTVNIGPATGAAMLITAVEFARPGTYDSSA